MAEAISIAGLTKCFGTTVAVDTLSLGVERGTIYGLLGLNGAGKSTIIRMLLGMVRPTSGSAYLFEHPVHAGATALWARVGYLLEQLPIYGDLTVRENLELVRCLRRLPDRRAVDRAIARLGLEPYARRRARKLSQGNLQRLGLAKALLHGPALVILNEPANALDPAGIVEVRDLLSSLASDHGVTCFMSSHLLGEVTRLATRIGILHQGRLMQELDAATLDDRRRRALLVDAAGGGRRRPRNLVSAYRRPYRQQRAVSALWAEAVKVVRSRVPRVTALGALGAPIVGGLFMAILNDPHWARRAGLITTKAQLTVAAADWLTYWSLLAQAVAVGGLVLFGLTVIWVFGRAYSERTVTDLLALPTPRRAIVGANLS